MHVTSRHYRRRRTFLQRAACVALLGSGEAAMRGKLALVGSALAQEPDPGDFKSLVCVFLYGGSDSHALFAPTDPDRHAQYAAGRGTLARPLEQLLATAGDAGDAAGVTLGFDPGLPDLHAMYGDGRLALLANVGNLIEPVTRTQYQNGALPIPEDLFAHNHQQEQWMKAHSSLPSSLVGTGWGGRMADLLAGSNTGSLLPPTFSLNGSNDWLPGALSQPTRLNTRTGLDPLAWLDTRGGSRNAARADALSDILAHPGQHPLKRQVALGLRRARDGSGAVVDALATAPSLATPHDQTSRLAQQLRMVARLIGARSALGLRRQIFFVGLGGWDTHDHQTPRLSALGSELNRSLSDFQATLDELGVADRVTTFTASDFGRTLTVNGDGSDHGWGGHYLVMGGAVSGGRVYGRVNDHTIDGPDDSGDKGRIIPTTSVNQYGAALASWMGVDDTRLHELFPDLANFGSDWRSGIDPFPAA